MARQRRQISESGYYHIMMRGNNKENVFSQDQDKEKVISILEKLKDDKILDVYAYCLMDNHIHLVVRDVRNEIGMTMRRFGVIYSLYYNKANNRVGHVFQERYKSEAIEEESFLMAVIRYVHKNPVKAKMVKRIQDYKWSSYNLYRQNINELVNVEDIVQIYTKDTNEGVKGFIAFHNEEDNRVFLEDKDEQEKMEIERAWDIVEKELDYAPNSVGDTGKRYIAQIMVDKTNLSKRKIAEIVGLNRGVVQKMKKQSVEIPRP